MVAARGICAGGTAGGGVVSRISGVAQWLACWAHNSKVGGSKPLSAIFVAAVFTRRTGCRFASQFIQQSGFVGLVVMTLASHARGPRFNPGTKYIGIAFCFFVAGSPCILVSVSTIGLVVMTSA